MEKNQSNLLVIKNLNSFPLKLFCLKLFITEASKTRNGSRFIPDRHRQEEKNLTAGINSKLI
jgi:hypothetical protein